MDNKFITYKNLKVGQKIEGFKDGNRESCFTAYVKNINSAFVTVAKFREDGKEEKINSTFLFTVKITQEEFEKKYREEAKSVLKGIQNKLNRDEIGYHEMSNAWLYGDPYEMAEYCIKEKIKIVGYSADIISKTAMFSGDILDVGVCAEHEDGERFWCHYRKSDIENMLEDYKELLG